MSSPDNLFTINLLKMPSYTLLDRNYPSEEHFRSSHGDAVEHSQQCTPDFQIDLDNLTCDTTCNYLVSSDTHNHEPTILGVNCVVLPECWGGDPEDITAYAMCESCYKDYQKHLEQLEFKQEKELLLRSEQSKRLTAQYRDYWTNLTYSDYEDACASLLSADGYACEVTPKGKDGGIDLYLSLNEKSGAAQCKNKVTPTNLSEVRDFWGAVSGSNLDFGIFFSRSGFTRDAKQFIDSIKSYHSFDHEACVQKSVNHAIKPKFQK